MNWKEYLTLRALPAEVKIKKSLKRIEEWIEHYGEESVYMSLSGGIGSTVLYWLLKQVNPKVPALFVNNSNEYPEVVHHVYALKAQNNKKFANITKRFERYNYEWNTYDNIVIRNSKNKMCCKSLEKTGYLILSKSISRQISDCRKIIEKRPNDYMEERRFQSMINPENRFSVPYKYQYLIYQDKVPISNKCCLLTKEAEFLAYERETGRRYPITGEQAEESRDRREAYLKFGCNGYDREHPKSTPLGAWTQQDLLWTVKTYNIPYATCYGNIIKDRKGKWITTGERRTGCICCTAGIMSEKGENRFQRMQSEHPKHYEYAMKPLKDGGLGMTDVLDILHLPYEEVTNLSLEEMLELAGFED